MFGPACQWKDPGTNTVTSTHAAADVTFYPLRHLISETNAPLSVQYVSVAVLNRCDDYYTTKLGALTIRALINGDPRTAPTRRAGTPRSESVPDAVALPSQGSPIREGSGPSRRR